MYDLIAEKYSAIFPLEEESVRFIRSYCTKKDAAVLDIGCAVGDLAIALAKTGCRVTGIDVNAQMIKQAQEKAAGMQGNAEFKIEDMTAIGTAASYDCAVCMRNTLPHIPSWEALGNFFRHLYRILRKDGIFIFQILNYDRILHEKNVRFNPIENNEFLFRRQYSKITEEEVRFEISFYDKRSGTVSGGTTKLLPLTSGRLQDCLRASGFTEIEQFSDYAGSKAGFTDFYHLYAARPCAAG